MFHQFRSQRTGAAVILRDDSQEQWTVVHVAAVHLAAVICDVDSLARDVAILSRAAWPTSGRPLRPDVATNDDPSD